jgi:peptidoglycan/LPS O-acetylase OafA/YrhL
MPCLIGLLILLAILDRAGVPNFVIAKNRQLPGYAPHPSLPGALFAALTFHVNVIEARTSYLPAAWDVLWSLSVEEVFYIFFPLVAVIFKKQSIFVALLLCLCIVGPFARMVLTHNPIWAEYGYFSCMDGIAIGCLAALLASQVRVGKHARVALLTIGSLLCLLIQFFRVMTAHLGLYKMGLDETVLEIGVALLLIVFQ